ncbi:hypothetical protein WHR41_07259 [Cladosporium halotolerans]|uniref:Ca3427-like PBP 2 domain-containing protein n=1 Tax=Cladosporium halotolerans TaxID=1052096 RepID=A0AB34KGR6_9PEZI
MLSRKAVQMATSTANTRAFSSATSNLSKLRIGYIPEHFSTPLAFAQQHFSLSADLIPVPTGTGDLTKRLKTSDESQRLDVAIGLTEGFVADLGKSRAAAQEPGYGLVGTYVESPLRWAISTGKEREDVRSVEDLNGKRAGVSRIGSGSYVMAYVLADQQKWLSAKTEPFTIVPSGAFAALRQAVRSEPTKADFFMWEHFTTKAYWDNGELKRIGEIYTPWPSWMIAAREPTDPALQDLAEKLNAGVQYYMDNEEEAVKHITGTMEYSEADAREWMKTVEFTQDVRGVDPGVVDKTVGILKKAGVLGEKAGSGADLVAIKRAERAREE